MKDKLRCYTFTNYYLSSIQIGIQSGHASMELVNKYLVQDGWVDGFAEQVADWLSKHKTIVCLNGGNADGIRDWKRFFDCGMQSGQNTFPYAGFFEDEQSLDGALTSVAVILPTRIFGGAAMLRLAKYKDDVHVTWDHLTKELRAVWTDEEGVQRTEVFTEWERDLMNKLNNMQLAR